jgi:hypothetical protein
MSEEEILSRAKMIERKSEQVPVRTMKAYGEDMEVKVHPTWPRGGVEVNSTVSLISALDGRK